jgi:hypothetical protein
LLEVNDVRYEWLLKQNRTAVCLLESELQQLLNQKKLDLTAEKNTAKTFWEVCYNVTRYLCPESH